MGVGELLNLSKAFFSGILISFNPFCKSLKHGIFFVGGGFNFWSRNFLAGFVGSPRELWVLIFASIRSSPSLEIRSTPRVQIHIFRSCGLFFFLGGGGASGGGILWVCEDLTSA